MMDCPRHPGKKCLWRREQLKRPWVAMQWDVGGRIREEGGCQIKLLSLDFTLCAEKWVGGFEVVRCDFIININFKTVLQLLSQKGLEGRDRSWVL